MTTDCIKNKEKCFLPKIVIRLYQTKITTRREFTMNYMTCNIHGKMMINEKITISIFPSEERKMCLD